MKWRRREKAPGNEIDILKSLLVKTVDATNKWLVKRKCTSIWRQLQSASDTKWKKRKSCLLLMSCLIGGVWHKREYPPLRSTARRRRDLEEGGDHSDHSDHSVHIIHRRHPPHRPPHLHPYLFAHHAVQLNNVSWWKSKDKICSQPLQQNPHGHRRTYLLRPPGSQCLDFLWKPRRSCLRTR